MQRSCDRYQNILYEQLLHEFKTINEGIDAILETMATKKDLEPLIAKDKAFEAAVKDLSRMVAQHEQRIGALEANAA